MTNKAKQIADMIDILPEKEQDLAYEMIKRMILAWDSDFTKVTSTERTRIDEAEKSGYIPENQIDWDNLSSMNLD